MYLYGICIRVCTSICICICICLRVYMHLHVYVYVYVSVYVHVLSGAYQACGNASRVQKHTYLCMSYTYVDVYV
jgi:hypothetical protein